LSIEDFPHTTRFGLRITKNETGGDFLGEEDNRSDLKVGRETNFFFDVFQFQSNIFSTNTRISFDIFIINIRHFDTLSIGHQHATITDSTTATFDLAHDDHSHFLVEREVRLSAKR
jgi:hypothetical protein